MSTVKIAAWIVFVTIVGSIINYYKCTYTTLAWLMACSLLLGFLVDLFISLRSNRTPNRNGVDDERPLGARRRTD